MILNINKKRKDSEPRRREEEFEVTSEHLDKKDIFMGENVFFVLSNSSQFKFNNQTFSFVSIIEFD